MSISEHIRALREKVGNELLLFPSSAALVHHAGRDRWRLPGGAVEPDELAHAVLERVLA